MKFLFFLFVVFVCLHVKVGLIAAIGSGLPIGKEVSSLVMSQILLLALRNSLSDTSIK